MSLSEKEIDVNVRVVSGGVTTGMAQAVSGVKSGVAAIKTEFSALGSVVSSLKSPFVALTAIMAGGAFFKHTVESTHAVAEELDKASEKTGMTVEQLSRLKYAAHQVDMEM